MPANVAGNTASRKDELMSSMLQKRAHNSQTSLDSSRGSEAVITMPGFSDGPVAGASHGHSDTDLVGLQKRMAGPGSVQSDVTDEGSVARVSGRPAAGWKGRMSSMLLRNPSSTSLKADSIKAKKVMIAFTSAHKRVPFVVVSLRLKQLA